MSERKPVKPRVVIAEWNEEVAGEIASYFERTGDFEIAGVTGETDVLNLVSAIKPEIAVVDFSNPLKNRLELLREIKRALDSEEGVIIAIDLLADDSAGMRQALDCGADYFYIKPLRAGELVKMAEFLYEAKRRGSPRRAGTQPAAGVPDARGPTGIPGAKRPRPEDFAAELLFGLGISNNVRGYAYIKSAIIQVINDESLLNGVTKGLYPGLARNFRVTTANIEHSLHIMLERAWERDPVKFCRELCISAPSARKCPSIKEFLAKAAEVYKSLANGGAG